MKTNELTGDALLWAVAVCMGYTDLHRIPDRMPHEPQLAMMPPRRDYGAMELWEIGSVNDWGFFGSTIEHEKIALEHLYGAGDAGADVWVASMTYPLSLIHI